MNLKAVLDIAIRAYKEGVITREALTEFLEGMINAAALENGYADRFGLPFPARSAG